jgi:flagellar basal body-associated protein FliL
MSRGLMIALVSAVLVLALGVAGIAAYVFVVMPHSQGEKAAVAETPKVEAKAGGTVPLKKFVTNLADKDRIRYIDVSIALGVKATADAEEVAKMEPEIRDVVLKQIRSLTSQDLSGSEGKDKMAEMIQKGLAELLNGKLVKVYVTDMVIQ